MFDFDAISIESASDFRCLEPPTDALPAGPDFMFGSPAGQVLTSYYASRYLHEIGVYRCEGVILEDGALMRGDGGYIVAPQANLHGGKIRAFLDERPPSEDRPLVEEHRLCAMIAGPGQNVFGHWLVDFLPKLFLLESTGYDVDAVKFVFSKTIPDFGFAFLKILGIPEENIILHDFSKERLLARTLLVPTKMHNGVRACVSLAGAAAFLARRAGLAREESSDSPARLLVSRSGWKSRTLGNREVIEDMAIKAGFASVKPESLSLRDQIKLFFGAREIIGEYGSGLHGTIFSPANVVVCGLRGSSFQPMFIQSALGSALTQPTGYVFGTTDERDALEPFVLDPEVFQACLANVFPSLRPKLNVRPSFFVASANVIDEAAAADFALTELDRERLLLVEQIAGDPSDDQARAQLAAGTSGPTAAAVGLRADIDAAVDTRADIDVEFNWLGNCFAFCKRGWWGAEINHRWTMGGRSDLLMKEVDPARDYEITVTVIPFVAAPTLPRQRLVVRVNATVVGCFSIQRISDVTCFVPSELLQNRTAFALSFACPDHASPTSLKLNADTRDIAFAFLRMTLRAK